MVDRLSIVRAVSADSSAYSVLLNECFDRAMALDGKLSEKTAGMSGRNYRCFINNFIGELTDARYLEVGSWRGSTACSAIEGNAVQVLCIDNWSWDAREEFHRNVAERLTEKVNFRFIESDFRHVNFATIGKYNVYLFDGPHEKQDQFDGLEMALPALDDEFVMIVDDWNLERVRQGTFDAIATCVDLLSSIEIRTTQDGLICECMNEYSDWHNGYFLAVLRKNAASTSQGHHPVPGGK